MKVKFEMNTDRLLQKIDTVLNDTEQQLQAGIDQVLDIGDQHTSGGPRLENPLAYTSTLTYENMNVTTFPSDGTTIWVQARERINPSEHGISEP